MDILNKNYQDKNMKEYEGLHTHLIILGEKLNGFKPARSQDELDKYISMAKKWIEAHPDEPYNFYKA